MGYSANPELVERRKHLLVHLESGTPCSWTVTKNLHDTNQYAWEIREALYIASLYPDRFPKLAEAHKRFSIRVAGPGRIEAVEKGIRGEVQIAETYHPIPPRTGISPMRGLE